MRRPTIITGTAELEALVGSEIGTTDWLTITQPLVTSFADITGDHQWIHVDEARAAASAFNGTIAHGFLVLALLPQFAASVYELHGFPARLNYGVNAVRFPRPLPVGTMIRDRITIDSVTPRQSGALLAVSHSVETPDGGRPVCVAQSLTLLTT
ncbi:acyl dehydratase [Mycolicibacterium mucogenicum 261Sha1.1M5]|nr:acyl dehydratase [Mycolicibacterium mucogenicum 261Sha1.1M5]